MPKLTKLLVVLFLAFAPILTFTPTAQAEPLQGLGVSVYTYDSRVLPERQAHYPCVSAGVWTSVSNIDANWGDGVVAGCQSDHVVVHYSGFLTAPKSGNVVFRSWADDGFYFALDGMWIIDDWFVKGCDGGSAVVPLVAGQKYRVDAWFYEFSGGACNRLSWDVDGVMSPVPGSVFSYDGVRVEPPVDPVEPPVDPVDPVDPVEPEPPVVEPEPVKPPVEPVKPPVVEEPVIEVPVVEPSVTDLDLAEIDPQSLSDADVALLLEDALQTFETAVEGSEEYLQALEQLMVVAQADDIVISEELAAVPVLGATVVGLTDAFNALGNFGADMSPKVRAVAEKSVVSAVIVTQIATTAVGLTVSAPSPIRRIV